jgi:lipoprotein-anchoring transpeptidase ErfK/SrfK
MVRKPRGAARASWVSLTLASALMISLPMAASMAGTALAAPIPQPTPVTTVSARLLHPTGVGVPERRPGPPSVPVGGRTREPRAVRTGWDRASLLVHVPGAGIVARRNPWSGASIVGTVAATSKYYHVPIVIRIEATNPAGTWGRVELPYVWPRVDGWIPLVGLEHDRTFLHVDVDLSEHRVRVYEHDDLLYSVAGATGATSSPTPPGAYVVTDRVPFPSGGALGTFAFGISGIQPHLPAGWSGGNQLAIHGTNDPSSIGTSASAGCVRVSEWTLDRLRPLLELGTPVIIHP